MPRPGNAEWAGTSDGVAARGFVNGRARRAAVGGKAPQVRTGPKSLPEGRLGRGDSSNPAGITRQREPSAPDTKKESRLIAESGLSKRGSYLLSHLV